MNYIILWINSIAIFIIYLIPKRSQSRNFIVTLYKSKFFQINNALNPQKSFYILFVFSVLSVFSVFLTDIWLLFFFFPRFVEKICNKKILTSFEQIFIKNPKTSKKVGSEQLCVKRPRLQGRSKGERDFFRKGPRSNQVV